MRNFQGIIFIRRETYTEIFKSALVYLQVLPTIRTLAFHITLSFICSPEL